MHLVSVLMRDVPLFSLGLSLVNIYNMAMNHLCGFIFNLTCASNYRTIIRRLVRQRSSFKVHSHYQNAFGSVYPPRYVLCAADVISCDNEAYWLYDAVIEYCGGYGGGGNVFIELRRSIDVVAKPPYPSKSLVTPVDTNTVPLASDNVFVGLPFIRRDWMSLNNLASFVGDGVGVVEFPSILTRFDL